MTKIIICASLFVLLCCKPNCEEDLEFRDNYFNAVRILEDSHKGGLETTFWERSKAIEVLEFLIGYSSKIDKDSDTPFFFKNFGELDSEVVIWNRWYEDNKCSMKNSTALRLFEEKKKPFPDYSDEKVLAQIKDMFPEHLRDSARYLDSTSRVMAQVGWPSHIPSTTKE